MYAWIWARLPGRPLVRAGCALLLTAAAGALLWLVVFPALAPRLPVDDTTVAR